MTDLGDLRIRLNEEEWDILRGGQGPVLQKVLRTVVLYGEALGAERLVDIQGDGHFVIAYALPGIGPSLEMLDELVAAGLKTKLPFTLDPKPPLDFENWWLSPGQAQLLEQMYQGQERYNGKMLQLGLRDSEAYTCTPYLPQVGNIPKRGATLAWSESACAIFANSVLAARTNKNGAIIDLLCGIVGKAPLAGLLTDEGRRAAWLIEIDTDRLPPPQLLGAAIGAQVLADVPYIVGLDRFLGPGINAKTRDYLHEMGAACATAGAVALYHVENITPEAIDYGRELLIPSYKTDSIDDQRLQNLLASYPVKWSDKGALPDRCFIGCPHLSLEQLYWWTNEISKGLAAQGQGVLPIRTTLCAAPQVLQEFRSRPGVYRKLASTGAKLSTGCPMQLFDNELSAGQAIVTNSNKLRAYTSARFYPDQELVEILTRRKIGGES